MLPVLRALPADAPLAVLDAGCGDGAWCRRIAAMRPHWKVTGIDQDAAQIARAREIERREPIGNVSYIEADFLKGVPGSYDVILSIASIHYAAAAGNGAAALRGFASALAPGGTMALLVPRREAEQPAWRMLPRPRGWPVFTPATIAALARDAGLAVREMRGLYGPWCLMGKQMAMWGSRSRVRRLASAPLQVLVRALPIDLLRAPAKPSYALRLVLTR